MTKPIKSQIIDISLDYDQIRLQLIYHNLYRQLRFARNKYKLSINELLIISGIRLYTSLISQEFTKGSIMKFVGYYNARRIAYYFKSLEEKGFLYVHRTTGDRVYYRININTVEIVRDMFEGLERTNRKFCEKYNVSL